MLWVFYYFGATVNEFVFLNFIFRLFTVNIWKYNWCFCSLILHPAAALNSALIVLLCEFLRVSYMWDHVISNGFISSYSTCLISFSYLIVWCSCVGLSVFVFKIGSHCVSKADLKLDPPATASWVLELRLWYSVSWGRYAFIILKLEQMWLLPETSHEIRPVTFLGENWWHQTLTSDSSRSLHLTSYNLAPAAQQFWRVLEYAELRVWECSFLRVTHAFASNSRKSMFT